MRRSRVPRILSVVGVLAVSSVGLGAAAGGAGPVRPQVDPAAEPRSVVFECLEVRRGPDPNAVVRTHTLNFGFDTLVVRKAERLCEPALKLPADTDLGGQLVEMQPNVTIWLGTDAEPHQVMLTGALGLLRESPASPSTGKVLGASLQGGAMGLDSFFDVFLEVEAVGTYQVDSFFDVHYRVEFDGGPASASSELQHDGGGMYSGAMVPAVQMGGRQLTQMQLVLHDNPAVTRVLECFVTRRGTDPNDPYLLVTRNFGTDKVIVRESRRLCEGALKTREPLPAGQALPLEPPDLVWECFRLSDGDNPNRGYRLFTRNFGEHRVRVHRAVMLCEDARKVRIDATGQESAVGHATGRVWECYRVRGENQAQTYWLTTLNFGHWPVRVTRPMELCERAQKVPQYTFAVDRVAAD